MATAPIHITVGSHGYWLQPNGTWTADQAGTKPLTGSALKSAQQAYAAQGGAGPGVGGNTGGTQPPPAVPISNAGIPGLPGPTPAPKPIVEPGYTGPDSRFGSYQLNPYVVGAGYAPPAASAASFPGVPGGTPAPVPSPTPAPSPAPTPVPAPAPGGLPGGSPSGTPGSAGGQGGGAGGMGWNAGGAQQADRTGYGGSGVGYGGNSGFAQPGAQNAPGGIPRGVPGAIDIGWGDALLSAAATAAPFPYGAGLGLAQDALRGYNVSQVDALRAQQGLPPLDAGQWAGGIFDLNKYGNLGGDQTVANPNQFTPFINDRISQMYNPATNPNVFGQPNLYAPNSMAETSYGQDYQPGAGGILGFFGNLLGLNGSPSHAWSAQNTSAFLGGPGSMGSTATGDMGARGIPAPSNSSNSLTAKQIAANQAKVAANRGDSGAFAPGTHQYNASADVGFGPGNYASSTGAPSGPAITRGYAEGGYVGPPPQISKSKDGKKRQVYWPQEDWTVTYGDPTDTPGAPTKPTPGTRVSFADGGFIPGGAPGTVPMMTGVEGGWPIQTNPGSLKVNISGSGHSQKRRKQVVAAKPALSESDLLNMAELARHQHPQQQIAGGVPQLAGMAPGSGDLYRRGGYVPGRRDNITDNRPINADEGEFVIRRQAAQMLGPRILNAMNDPRMAFHFRSLLERHFGG